MTSPTERTDHEVLVSIGELLEELLAETRHIRAALGSAANSRSSVAISTGANGRSFDIAVKSYGPDSPVIDAESEALQSFLRLRAELEDRLMANFKATVEGLR